MNVMLQTHGNILVFYKETWFKITILLSSKLIKVKRFQNNSGINTIIGY